MTKEILGYVILIICYIGLFWAFPFFATDKDVKSTITISLLCHAGISVAGLLAFLIYWCFA